MNKIATGVGLACGLVALQGHAGGDPDFVRLPAAYAQSFANYATFNRAGKELVARMYANDIAVSSYTQGRTASRRPTRRTASAATRR